MKERCPDTKQRGARSARDDDEKSTREHVGGLRFAADASDEDDVLECWQRRASVWKEGDAHPCQRHALGRLRVLKESVEQSEEWLAQARGAQGGGEEVGRTEFQFWS